MSHRSWKRYLAGLILCFSLSTPLFAQVPGGAGAPAAPAPAAAAAGGGGNLWSFLLPSAEQKVACKERWCNSAVGKLFRAVVQPVAAFSGGLITNRCEFPTEKDLEQPKDSAQGAAARIKQDALEAKARREAVRYLGTVDCGRWPEAEMGIINALRGDRNECVRFEAAIVAGRGCCCTPKIVEALSITASGSSRDGFPRESSARVRAAAMASLNHCLACLKPQIPIGPGPIQTIPPNQKKQQQNELPRPQMSSRSPAPKSLRLAKGSKKTPNTVTHQSRKSAYYNQITPRSVNPIVTQAQKVKQSAALRPEQSHKKTNGLFEIVGNAFTANPNTSPMQVYQPIPSNTTPYNPVIVQESTSAPRGLIPALRNHLYGAPAVPLVAPPVVPTVTHSVVPTVAPPVIPARPKVRPIGSPYSQNSVRPRVTTLPPVSFRSRAPVTSSPYAARPRVIPVSTLPPMKLQPLTPAQDQRAVPTSSGSHRTAPLTPQTSRNSTADTQQLTSIREILAQSRRK